MRRSLSQNTRVLAVIASMALASLTVGGLVYFIADGDATRLDAATGRQTNLDLTAAAIGADLERQHGALDDYVLSGNPVARQRYLEAVTAAESRFADLRRYANGDIRLGPDIDDLEAATKEWQAGVAVPVGNAATAGDLAVLERFRAQAIDDHTAVRAALRVLGEGLSDAKVAIADEKTGVAIVQKFGIAAAFGFMMIAFGIAMLAVRRFGRALERDARQARVLNRFTEVTSFAIDDREVAAANLVALGRLIAPDAGVTHILNRSSDRAVPEAASGDAIAEILPLHALSRCAGVARGTMYVTDDLSDTLTVRCPVYPATSGTLACIPLISGESVGAVHLYWRRPRAFPLDLRASVARITEHAALAIGNRRLLAALHGQANTDARTGLVNSRAFDIALERAISTRAGDEAVSVLMIDVDHFKHFNDRHGHPAGDEALRAFAAVLRSCMRDGDIAARYGGEEFAVFLPGIGIAAAAAIAERIRIRTESTIISLSPGITDRITISIGIATAPDQAHDRVTLLRLADEALYRAKADGRNRVAGLAVPHADAASEPLAPAADEPRPISAAPTPRRQAARISARH